MSAQGRRAKRKREAFWRDCSGVMFVPTAGEWVEWTRRQVEESARGQLENTEKLDSD
jgi:hypothetical protein